MRVASGRRTPTATELSALSRDDWESLGHDLCGVIYDAERVEDRLGRGNGLDAVRQLDEAGTVDGWQFRRFDDRLGNTQIVKLREAVDRAVATCGKAFSAPLRKFTVFGNIDLQPGHGKVKGEDARFSEFRDWCETQHGVEATYRGVTWVRTRLLKYPYLRPELFEDIPSAINDAKRDILDALDGQTAMRRALDELKAQADGQLAVLAGEATLHFERGQERGQAEEFRRAIESLRDAERLARAPGVEPRLHLRVQIILTGTLYVSGFLTDAVSCGRDAVAAAEQLDEPNLLRLAMGNLALALSDSQEYQEARKLFLKVLRMDEDAAESAEIVRTLANLLSVDVRRKDWGRAAAWVRRLEPEVLALDKMIGPSQTSINTLGNIATFYLDRALTLPEPMQTQGFELAAKMFSSLAETCRQAGLSRTLALTESNTARVLWFLNRYKESDAAFDRAVESAGEDLGKVAADSRYNQAIMRAEAGRMNGALIAATDALHRYERIGDAPSALDARNLIRSIPKQGARSD